MSQDNILMSYYIKYLKEVRKVSESSVNHYLDALKYISNYLIKKKMIDYSIYEISDIGELEVVKDYLYNEPDFVALNARGHQMYSAGLNNYFRFASGDGLINAKEKMSILDMEVPIGDKQERNSIVWHRSSIIKEQSIKSANYECEINKCHKTFIAKSSGHQYMEGHHAIPMKNQERFYNSLDVYANVVCVCPICHRLLHYGMDDDKEMLLNQIYVDRMKRLVNSGIKVSKDEFLKIAM